MPIKAGWRDGSLALWDFSRNNKHYIHLSTTKTIYCGKTKEKNEIKGSENERIKQPKQK